MAISPYVEAFLIPNERPTPRVVTFANWRYGTRYLVKTRVFGRET